MIILLLTFYLIKLFGFQAGHSTEQAFRFN